MGGRETNTVYLNDVRGPRRDLLGEVDHGWTQLMAGLNVERLILSATMLGIAERAFDDALAYAKERKQFGGRSARSRPSSIASPTSPPSSRRGG